MARRTFTSAEAIAAESVEVEDNARRFYYVPDFKQVDDELLFIWAEAVSAYLAGQGGTRITQIEAAFLSDIIRPWLTESFDEGWGPVRAARELRKRWDGLKGPRAERIARTELVSANNFGSMLGAESVQQRLGRGLRKAWLATMDGRVRETHAAADGQTRGLQEAFNVGGASLQYPGDPGAPAAEVINCRCTQTFELIQDE